MKKKVLVINLGWEQEPLILRLAALDVDLYGIHSTPSPDHASLFTDIALIDYRDIEAILTYAKTIAPDAVISDQCDYSYFAQAAVAETLNLPGPTLKNAFIATNKYLQRQKALAQNLTIPAFELCLGIEDVERFAQTNGYPIILKPVDNRGSFGVNKVSTPDEIQDAFLDALSHSHSYFVLAEAFIDGIHITVDGYVFQDSGPKSLTLATKALTQGARQVALEITYPGELDPALYAKAMEVNETVNQALGFSFGMSHSEYMIRDNEVYLIESANRGGGVFTSELIAPTVSGIDLLDLYINDVLNLEPSHCPKEPERNNVVLKFFQLSCGKIASIKGVEEIHNHPQVLAFKLQFKEGDTIQEITTDADRHGFIIVKDPINPSQKAEEIISSLEVTYA
ncbi:MAG: ATP-grasp domain-containing protein [Sulfuricurvum sp.]|nr:ATP-grasp domain-containing protein [Sulfuricurvum sp.]